MGRAQYPTLHQTMKKLTGLILIVILGCTTFSASSDAISLEFRSASQSPINGFQEMTVVGSVDKIFISQEVIISESDISSAEIVGTSDRPLIEIFLTEGGVRKLSRATEANIGTPLGIIIDDKLFGAPIIRQAINTSSMIISGQLTQKEVSDVVDRINTR